LTSAIDYNSLTDDAFRAEVRAFFAQHYPEALCYLQRRVRMAEIRSWWRTLYEKGWIAPNWTREWGGMALDAGKMVVFLEEMERHGIAREAIQIHGAIGFTDEYDAGLYLQRALVLASWLGNAALHRRRYAQLTLGLAS
jgi:alkylation response protein AidB-like acyl-CoA dehydrogenase